MGNWFKDAVKSVTPDFVIDAYHGVKKRAKEEYHQLKEMGVVGYVAGNTTTVVSRTVNTMGDAAQLIGQSRVGSFLHNKAASIQSARPQVVAAADVLLNFDTLSLGAEATKFLATHPFAAKEAWKILNECNDLKVDMEQGKLVSGYKEKKGADNYAHTLACVMCGQKGEDVARACYLLCESKEKLDLIKKGNTPDAQTDGKKDMENNLRGLELGKAHPSANPYELIANLNLATNEFEEGHNNAYSDYLIKKELAEQRQLSDAQLAVAQAQFRAQSALNDAALAQQQGRIGTAINDAQTSLGTQANTPQDKTNTAEDTIPANNGGYSGQGHFNGRGASGRW